MKPQTAFIVISVVLLLAVLYIAIYVISNKSKMTMYTSTGPVTPQIKRTVSPAVYNQYSNGYLNSFGNQQLIRVK